MISEISDDDCQSDDGMIYEDDDQETHFQVDSRIRVKPEFMTTLELNSITITQYLKPFKSQLTNSHLSNLAEFPELKPYITTPSTKKSVEDDSSSDESYLPVDEDIPPNQRRPREVLNGKVFNYPLTEQQIYILNQFRQADTLIFTSLPSQECMMKLIALSVLVSQPFYGQVLFPNVEKVVYSSAMQEKSLVDRYAYLGSTFDPHPITFALDWLVYDFSLCIHSASSTFRNQWIQTRVRNDDSNEPREFVVEKYQKKWRTLNPLGGTMLIDDLPRLQSISYHNVLPGDRPQFTSLIETYIYFGLHQELDTKALGITLKDIAKSTFQGNQSQIPILDALHLVNIENLSVDAIKKNGPKAKVQQSVRREEMLRLLLRQIMEVFESGGREFMASHATYFRGKLHEAADVPLREMPCLTCGNRCEEASCSE
jgi:hypothetical protein